MSVPALKKGWLKKQSRTGMVRNWQTRYFVLNVGRIYYYQEQTDCFPYGEILKGEMTLINASVVQYNKKQTDKQIFISGANGEKSLLMEAESASVAQEWSEAIQMHCDYATAAAARGDFDVEKNDKVGSHSLFGRNTVAAMKQDHDNDHERGSDADGDVNLDGSGDHLVTPKPAWVIKVLRTNGEKIFINLCEHPDIPQTAITMGYSKWPFMVLTPVRTCQDEKGGDEAAGSGKSTEISIYDAVVNPAVVVLGGKEPAAKDATCLRALRLLKKKFGEELETEYKLPKITKKYKGDIQQVRIPNNIQSLLKTRASMTLVAGLTGAVSRGRAGSSGPAPSSSSSSGAGSTLVLGEGGAKKVAGGAPAAFNRQMSEPPPRSEAAAPSSGRSSNSGLSKVFLDPSDRRNNSVLDVDYRRDGTGSGGSGKLQRSLTETPSGGGSAGSSDKKPTPALAKFARLPTVAKNIRASFSNRNSLTAASSEAAAAPTESEGGSSSAAVVNRRYIPYSIIRSQGTIAKQEPDKNAPGKVLGHGVRVFVMCRKVMSDGTAWLRTSEGWIQEKNGGVNRVLIPAIHGQPIGAKIITTRFEDTATSASARMSTMAAHNATSTASVSGWAMFSSSVPKDTFQTRFLLDILYPENAVMKLSRTYEEISAVRQTLLTFPDKVIKDRTVKAGDFPSVVDGNEDLLDVNELLYVVEGVENWLTKMLTSLPIDRCKCKALIDFLTPKEHDYYVMELELMANGGIGGHWAGEMMTDRSNPND